LRVTQDVVARALGHLAATDVPEFLSRQRWFGSKGRALLSVALLDCSPLGDTLPGPWLTLVEATFAEGPAELYAIPLVIRAAEGRGRLVGRLDAAPTPLWAYDALDDSGARSTLLGAFERGETFATEGGRARFTRTGMFPSLRSPESRSSRRVASEQSNTSVIYDETLILKAFRKIAPGINPDCEVAGFLTTRTEFPHIPLLAGTLEYFGPGGFEATLGMLQHFVPNQGDGWTFTLDHLKGFYANVRGHPEPGRASQLVREVSAGFLATVRRLGGLTGALHVALASDSADPAFAPEPIAADDVHGWAAAFIRGVTATLDELRNHVGTLSGALRNQAQAILDRQADLATQARGLETLTRNGCVKIRIHGDYHLGQTLRTADDFVILDFEGEPARSLAERRAKYCPLRDVAGMHRSFDYAAAVALREWAGDHSGGTGLFEAWGEAWARVAAETFLEGYEAEARRAPARLLPASRGAVTAALAVYELDKALYELRYELNNRPTWLPIPLRGLSRILGSRTGG